jgi:hypothetical protein
VERRLITIGKKRLGEDQARSLFKFDTICRGMSGQFGGVF